MEKPARLNPTKILSGTGQPGSSHSLRREVDPDATLRSKSNTSSAKRSNRVSVFKQLSKTTSDGS